ncbi:hypothetical protein ANCCAN_21221 [Ancylostoma caninum]|uniref:Uncharacterized protein n=1 Tax=Ancylostoma caninum TaxID=29170 RepID=A0A368FPM6_ANCCA|nr:hypothetical protein ANCCAN_21221 [Ancylostoma caninum]
MHRHMQRQGFGVYKLILLLIYGCCFWFLFKYLFWDHIQRRFFPEQDNQDQKYTDLLDRIELPLKLSPSSSYPLNFDGMAL